MLFLVRKYEPKGNKRPINLLLIRIRGSKIGYERLFRKALGAYLCRKIFSPPQKPRRGEILS